MARENTKLRNLVAEKSIMKSIAVLIQLILMWLLPFAKSTPVSNNEVESVKHIQSVIHTLHVCSTCNAYHSADDYPDIEDLGKKRSGVIMFHEIVKSLQQSGWTLLETIPADKKAPNLDARWDPSLSKSLLEKNGKKLMLVPVRCLSSCSAQNVLALRCLGKYVYQFGGLGLADIPDLVQVVDTYCESADGYSNVRSRPGSFSRNILARVPPSK